MSNCSVKFRFLITVCLVLFGKGGNCLLCDDPGSQWFCANSTTDTTLQTKLTNSKSCFCVGVRRQTRDVADAYCQAKGGYLTDIENDEENQLIVQLLQLANATQYMNACPSCPKKEYQFNHSCYNYVDNVTLDYLTAETYCQNNFGGHLVSIHNSAQYEFVWMVANNCSACVNIKGLHIGADHYGAAVGLAGVVNSTNWVWKDGSTFDYYMPITTDPMLSMNVSTLEQCSSLARSDGGWQDYACRDNTLLNFICEYSLDFFPAWIGLSKSATNVYNWKVGYPYCYQYKNASFSVPVVNRFVANTNVYAIDSTGKWVNKLSTDVLLGYVCRKDVPADNVTTRLTPLASKNFKINNQEVRINIKTVKYSRK